MVGTVKFSGLSTRRNADGVRLGGCQECLYRRDTNNFRPVYILRSRLSGQADGNSYGKVMDDTGKEQDRSSSGREPQREDVECRVEI